MAAHRRDDEAVLAELERGYQPESMCENEPCSVGGAPAMFVLRCRGCGECAALCLPCFLDLTVFYETQRRQPLCGKVRGAHLVDVFQVFSITGQLVL